VEVNSAKSDVLTKDRTAMRTAWATFNCPYHSCTSKLASDESRTTREPEREYWKRDRSATNHHDQIHPRPSELRLPWTSGSKLKQQNRQGKTRLSKWYTPYDDDEKVRLRGEVHRLIAPRDQKYQSNFVEVS
jgi:hypothetical protein